MVDETFLIFDRQKYPKNIPPENYQHPTEFENDLSLIVDN